MAIDDILNGASGNNPNTIIYIVNALNKDVARINTLATGANTIAREAADGVEQVVLLVTNVRSDFTSALELKADLSSLTMTNATLADLVTEYGDLVETVALKVDTSTFEQTAENITETFTSVNGDLDMLKTWIQAGIDGLLLGSSDSQVKLRIQNDKIEIIDGNDVVTYWSNVQQQTPKEFIVPTGGSFTIGNFRWVPRSSGNLSLVKV